MRTSSHSGALVVRPVGVLDSTTYRSLRDTLVKLAVDQPSALIVDLGELRIAQQSVLTVFSSVWMQVSEWPGVPILLVVADPSRRRLLHSAVNLYVACYASVDAALAAVGHPPPCRRATLDLDTTPSGSRVARAFVRETCERWDLSGHTREAVALTNELVDNVIQHAGTDCQVRLELRSRMLTVAVRDGNPHRAELRERLGAEPWGNGLRIVAEIAHTWGCAPHMGGGKVVWAVVRCA
ncbi:hypothetical protein AOZ06_23855 [Kibdelosporangium phytohabitans]|uniref:STAS domain-containing protein n=2 Tax=Kibdelosporangium phytohabitans TaxID=860235 RepID=A0A0N9IES9_9PSEU|nr:hypothetical protein AOZ06_23855 [Kibdelosporangium phytohabitans]